MKINKFFTASWFYLLLISLVVLIGKKDLHTYNFKNESFNVTTKFSDSHTSTHVSKIGFVSYQEDFYECSEIEDESEIEGEALLSGVKNDFIFIKNILYVSSKVILFLVKRQNIPFYDLFCSWKIHLI